MRNIFVVGAKLIGLTYLFSLIGIVPAAINTITWSPANPMTEHFSRVGSAVGYSIYFAGLAVVVYLLLVRSEWLAGVLRIPDSGPTVDSINARTGLQIGLILVGLYILVTTVPDMLQEVVSVLGFSVVASRTEILRIGVAILKIVLAGFILLRPWVIIELLWDSKEQEPAAA